MTFDVGPNIVVIILATIAAIPGIVAAYYARKAKSQTEQTHILFNSRMDELLAQARLLARAQGVAEGEQNQRDRTATPMP